MEEKRVRRTTNCSENKDKIQLRLFTGMKNLKKLVLEIGSEDDESLLRFTPLIEACSYLQIFVLKLTWGCRTPLKRKKRVIKAVNCPHYYLKVVEIGGYYGGSSAFELAMYFIENATKLEKIIIDPRYQFQWHNITGIVETKEKQEREQTGRCRARRQLEAKVPHRIKLEIL